MQSTRAELGDRIAIAARMMTALLLSCLSKHMTSLFAADLNRRHEQNSEWIRQAADRRQGRTRPGEEP